MSLLRAALVLAVVIGLPGCAGRFADNFAKTFQEYDDPATVAAAAPSYLLLAEALVRNDPKDADYRLAAATLNSTYAGSFVKEPERQQRLTQHALDHALVALCEAADLCEVRQLSVDELERRLARFDADDVPLLYTVGSAWAGWIQAHAADWNAVADLPRVERLMQRVVSLDERYQGGIAHLYLGGLALVVPPALGGRPEEARQHFERAITLSEGRNLMAKLLFAKLYARAMFDRELHDRLLNEVLTADPMAPGLTLVNRLAQQEARELLASADDVF